MPFHFLAGGAPLDCAELLIVELTILMAADKLENDTSSDGRLTGLPGTSEVGYPPEESDLLATAVAPLRMLFAATTAAELTSDLIWASGADLPSPSACGSELRWSTTAAAFSSGVRPTRLVTANWMKHEELQK